MAALALTRSQRRNAGLFLSAATWAVSAIFMFATSAVRSQSNYSEESIKAAYLYRFTQYVEWPVGPSSTFTIVIMDAPAVASELSKLLASHPIHNAPSQVRAIEAVSDVGDAAILYIGPERPKHLRSTIGALASRPLLIVTDNREGLSLGSTINFVKVDDHIRFEISIGSAERSKLHVSSELLGVAVRVDRTAPP
jgi:hypothetical protein